MQKQSVTVIAPAKLNLSLDVRGLLPNGYHDLDMVMQAITLREQLTLRRSESLTLRMPGSTVPVNDKNTAVKAALAFFDYTGLLAGVDITIRKTTPVRAGMAGGSADAAGVLVGMNELYGARLSMSELCALGASIGADVPFALMGGTCRVQGVGDLMKALPPCPPCWFVIAMPRWGSPRRRPSPGTTPWAARSIPTARPRRTHPRRRPECPVRGGGQCAGTLQRRPGDPCHLRHPQRKRRPHQPDDRVRRGGVRHF